MNAIPRAIWPWRSWTIPTTTRIAAIIHKSEPFMISFHMVGNTGAVVETGQGTRPSIGTRFAWYPLLRGARHAARFCAVPDMRPVRYTAAHSQLLVKA